MSWMGEALILSHTLGEAGDITEETLRGDHFLASIRLQLVPAAHACVSLGLRPRVMALRSESARDFDGLGRPEICLVGKLSHPSEEVQQRIGVANVAAIARLKRKGVPIGLIYSDNIALDDASSRSEMARDMIEYAHMVIFPSKAMERIGKELIEPGKRMGVIEDPWQVSEHPFATQSRERETRIIWFGHSSNAKYLLDVMEELLSARTSSNTRIFTAMSDRVTLMIIRDKLHSLRLKNRWQIRLVEWVHDRQPEQLDRELAWNHIAVIPSDMNDPKKRGVSHNRAVDAIRAGCITIASPMQSYRELEGCLLLGNNFGDLVSKACTDFSELSREFEANRDRVLQRFSPESNMERWKNVISDLRLSR